jgi:uncharacterized protein
MTMAGSDALLRTGTGGGTDATSRRASEAPRVALVRGLAVYFLFGAFLGILFTKSEVASWFRIQEMFRFGGFHMYGILGSAVAVAAASVAAIRRLGLRTIAGETIHLPPKTLGRGTRYWAGGGIFGMGWALTGACPGPMYALIGSGIGTFAAVLLFAVVGMWVYGQLRDHLPH